MGSFIEGLERVEEVKLQLGGGTSLSGKRVREGLSGARPAVAFPEEVPVPRPLVTPTPTKP